MTTLLSTTDYNGPENNVDYAFGVAVDTSGDIIVVGSEDAAPASTNWRIRRYNSTLTALLSTTDYNGTDSGADTARSVAIDNSGNIYVAGSETIGSSPVWLVRKYNSTLTALLSSTRYVGAGSNDDQARSIALDSAGNAVVAGEELGTVGSYNWLIRKYDPTLTTLLSSTDYNAPANSTDFAYAVKVDGSGNVFVSGSEWGLTGNQNMRLHKYDPSLSVLMSATTYSLGNGSEEGDALALDSSGNVVVVGREDGSVGSRNWMVRKYDQTLSVLLASTDYNGPANALDWANAVAVNSSGHVVVVGYEDGFAGATNWRVIKYSITSLQPQLTSAPATPVEGEVFSVALAVTNGGTASVYGVMPALLVTTQGQGLNQIGAVAPSLPQVIQGGSSTVFVWTFSSTGGGSFYLSITVTGIDAGTGLSVTSYVFFTGATKNPAGLQSWTASIPNDALPQPGQLHTVVMTVSNTGAVAANTLVPTLSLVAGSTSVALIAGPVPQNLATLAMGAATSFTWTFSVTGEGPILYSVTVTAVGAVVANPIFTQQGGILGVGSGAKLSPFITVSAGDGVSDRVTARVVVTNVGGVTALNVVVQPPGMWSNEGSLAPAGGSWKTGSITLLSVDPSSTVSSLPPGGSMTFTFVYAVTGHGTLKFNNPYASGNDAVTFGGCGGYAPFSNQPYITLVTLASALQRNIPDPGKIQIRRPVVRIASGDSAWVLARASESGGEAIRFSLYGRSGYPLGDLGEVVPDADGVARLEFDGRLGGRPLATGLYWIVTSGGMSGRHQVMVLNE